MSTRSHSAGVVLLALTACGVAPSTLPPPPDDTGEAAPDGDQPDAPVDSGQDAPDTPAVTEIQGPVLPRLTVRQLRHAYADLLGRDLPLPALEADTDPFFFHSIGAARTTFSEVGVQQLEEAAHAVVTEVFDDPARREALLGCTPSKPGDACVAGFLADFGRRAWRRPLTSSEAAAWLGVAKDLADGDPWTGVATAVAGLLQAPAFVYRIEQGEPDPNEPSRLRYTDFELASRLAFVLWDGPPDDLLLDAAEAGTLRSVTGLEAEARRMLDDPRARRATQEFFAQLLDLSQLDGITRDAVRYPDFPAALPASMATEVRLLVDDLVFRRDTDVRKLFTTRRTFVDRALAEHYGIDAPGASDVAFVPVDLPADGPRAGVLTLGAFLTINAHAVTTSPTLRGKFLRERVLCDEIEPPPPNVDADLEQDVTTGLTLREQLEQHRSKPQCAVCHDSIDPPGLLFENFDAVGAWRTLDQGQPIDASGDLDGVPLTSPVELGALLVTDPRVSLCLVKQLYRHAQGRLEHPAEEPALFELDDAFAAKAYRFRELLVALVTHDTFRFVALPEETP